MLQPTRTKFRKAHKGRIHGLATSAANLAFGQYGLKALEPERVTARQIEAARRALTRHMKRYGQVWIRVFPDKPATKKPARKRVAAPKPQPSFFDFFSGGFNNNGRASNTRSRSAQSNGGFRPFF